MEKGIARHEDADQAPPRSELDGEDVADRTPVTPGRGLERGEVMLAPERKKRLRHPGVLEGARQPPGPSLPEDGPDRTVQDQIGIALGHGRTPGVELRRNVLYGQNPDVKRKVGIQRRADRLTGEAALGLEVGHLAHGVDSGVCAARPDDAGARAGQIFNRGPQSPLDRRTTGLNLPSVICPPPVFNDEPDLPQRDGL